jgi:hypothetical protein
MRAPATRVSKWGFPAHELAPAHQEKAVTVGGSSSLIQSFDLYAAWQAEHGLLESNVRLV